MSKNIIVTGSSRGLGLAITRFLLETFSCNVVAVSRSTTQELQDLNQKYNNLVCLTGDVSKDEDNKVSCFVPPLVWPAYIRDRKLSIPLFLILVNLTGWFW